MHALLASFLSLSKKSSSVAKGCGWSAAPIEAAGVRRHSASEWQSPFLLLTKCAANTCGARASGSDTGATCVVFSGNSRTHFQVIAYLFSWHHIRTGDVLGDGDGPRVFRDLASGAMSLN